MRGRILPPTRQAILEAAGIIRSGGLVAFPTETVYGLGANALDSGAVDKIFEAKGRPRDNPLILHVASVEHAARCAVIDDRAEALMRRFWPGPLTLVLRSRDLVPEDTRGGLETVALRMPQNRIALTLIEESELPIAAPSANRSGRPSPTSARVVAEDLGGHVDLILDGGECNIGLESTVVDATGESIVILRPGGVSREMLAVEVPLAEDHGLAHRSPGTRYRHYAPNLPLLLWDGKDRSFFDGLGDEKWCYMGLQRPPGKPHRAALFESTEAYAKELFARLREFEGSEASVIVAELPQKAGIGEAVRNRLFRAAGG